MKRKLEPFKGFPIIAPEELNGRTKPFERDVFVHGGPPAIPIGEFEVFSSDELWWEYRLATGMFNNDDLGVFSEELLRAQGNTIKLI